MRSHPTLPLSHIRPDRLTVSIAATSTVVNHDTVAAKIHAAVLAALPDPDSDIAAKFDIDVHFDFAPYLTEPLIGRLRVGILVDIKRIGPWTDPAANLNAVVANEVERTTRDYRLTRVIADAQLLKRALWDLVHWDGKSPPAVIKALRDLEVLAVIYGADSADVLDYMCAAGRVPVVDHAGGLVPGAVTALQDDAVILNRAA